MGDLVRRRLVEVPDGQVTPFRSAPSVSATVPRRSSKIPPVPRAMGSAAAAVWVCCLLLWSGGAVAQENEVCQDCHDDPDLAEQDDSVYADPDRFEASVHGKLKCVDCHTALRGQEMPHETPVEPVRCGNCHAKQAREYAESLHGQAAARGDKLAPHCRDCHSRHDMLPVKDPDSKVAVRRVPFLCGRCHKEGAPVQVAREIPEDHIVANYSQSIHGEGLFKRGLTVTAVCTSCHTAHHVLPHTDPRSSINRNNVANTCRRCHSQIEQVHRKVIRGELWEKQPHLLPACVDCHSPHKIRQVFYEEKMSDADCMFCHARHDLATTRPAGPGSLFVDRVRLQQSVHGATPCVKCHTGATVSKTRPCSTITAKVDCSMCHAEAVEQYQVGIHGQLYAQRDPNAPSCDDCHQTHATMSKKDPASPTFPINVPNLCARCHREGAKAAVRYHGPEQQIIKHYTMSIHGKGLLQSGLVVTAMCSDCHTAHMPLPHTDPRSSVSRKNIAKTCARCHQGIFEQFSHSVHSPQVTHTDKPLPVCNDCHSSHTIRRTDETGFELGISGQCGQCHPKVTQTYFDTYHGKVSKLGYARTAKCYDCHGAHNILPPDDPRSTLSHDNIVATCGKCHPGSHRRFAGYLTHATHHNPVKYPILFYTFWGMTGLLATTLLVATLHTVAWLPRSLEMARQMRHARVPHGGRQVLRFTAFERQLHLMMLVSFFGLALTGMTLKFSYMEWARVLSRLLGGFESAGYIHRVCALITFAYFGLHLWDLRRRKTNAGVTWRQMIFGPNTLMFTRRDLREFIGSIRWFLRRGPRPNFGRWTYWEKFDYFAVFWGVAIIGSTGLMLWFPELFTHVFPGWLINVATIIHSDEALLAVAFIFTIHFFNTHFRPEKFPMDPVIFTGRVPLEEFKQDKPREYAQMVADGTLEDRLVEPVSPATVRVIKVLAMIALAVGLTLIGLIIYAMTFGYR